MPTLQDAIVRDIALTVPGAVRALETHHIDYCCGAGRTLRDACAHAGAALGSVVADIENESRHARARGESVDVVAMSIEAIIERIVAHHHAFVTRADARLRPLAHTVVDLHADRHVELRRTVQLVDALFAELIPHQHREERLLFPHVAALAQAEREGLPAPRASFDSIERLLDALEEQHESMDAMIDVLRAGCDGFRPPDRAGVQWRALYVGLEELERDLVRHVHLENNVLFPAARALEARVAAR